MNKNFACLFLVFFLVFAVSCEAAESQSKTGGSTPKKKFEASSLWGIRRGPNASPSPEMAPSAEEIYKKKAKMAEIAYQEEKAKQAYLNSLSKPPGSSNAVGGSSPKQEECARKK